MLTRAKESSLFTFFLPQWRTLPHTVKWNRKVVHWKVLYSTSNYKWILRPWQTRTHGCGHIVAHDVCWAAQTGKHLLRTQNVSEQNQKHFFVSRTQNLSPQQMLRGRANVETFVSATMCPRLPGPLQQCLVWGTLFESRIRFWAVIT